LRLRPWLLKVETLHIQKQKQKQKQKARNLQSAHLFVVVDHWTDHIGAIANFQPDRERFRLHRFRLALTPQRS